MGISVKINRQFLHISNPLPAAAYSIGDPTICRREIEILLFKPVYQGLLAITTNIAVFTCVHI
jgi:hypothetical protein